MTVRPYLGRHDLALQMEASMAELKSRASEWDKAGDMTPKEQKQTDASWAKVEAILAKRAELDRRRAELLKRTGRIWQERFSPDGRLLEPPPDPELPRIRQEIADINEEDVTLVRLLDVETSRHQDVVNKISAARRRRRDEVTARESEKVRREKDERIRAQYR